MVPYTRTALEWEDRSCPAHNQKQDAGWTKCIISSRELFGLVRAGKRECLAMFSENPCVVYVSLFLYTLNVLKKKQTDMGTCTLWVSLRISQVARISSWLKAIPRHRLITHTAQHATRTPKRPNWKLEYVLATHHRENAARKDGRLDNAPICQHIQGRLYHNIMAISSRCIQLLLPVAYNYIQLNSMIWFISHVIKLYQMVLNYVNKYYWVL